MVLGDFICMWYQEAKQSNSFKKIQVKKKNNATSDIDSLNSQYISFKGR